MMIQLETGMEARCPDGNYDLINGIVYSKTSVSEDLANSVRYIYNEFIRYQMIKKPLDRIESPQEALAIPQMSATVLKPEIAVTQNEDLFPSWVVEYQNSETEEICSCLKPVIYREAGVREYWVIDMEKEGILIYDFEKTGFFPKVVCSPQRLPVGVYKDFFISFSEIMQKK